MNYSQIVKICRFENIAYFTKKIETAALKTAFKLGIFSYTSFSRVWYLKAQIFCFFKFHLYDEIFNKLR